MSGLLTPVSMSLDFTFLLRDNVTQGYIKDVCSKLDKSIFMYISILEVPLFY